MNMLREIPLFWNFFAASVSRKDQAGSCIHLQDTPNRELEIILYQMLRTYLLDDEISHTVVRCYLIPLLTEMARIHHVEKSAPESGMIFPRNPSLDE